MFKNVRMLSWRKPNNLWYRHVHNINSVKEEKISISMSIEQLDGWWRYHREPHGKLAGSIFIFHFAADFAVANELELMTTYIIWEIVVIPVSWKDFLRIDRECWQYTHEHCTYSAVQSFHMRETRRTRLFQVTRIAVSFLCAENSVVIWCDHVSPSVALSVAVHHEHIIFLTHSSFYHDTRTRTAIGTARSIPRTHSASSRSPGRIATLSRTILAWSDGNLRDTFSTESKGGPAFRLQDEATNTQGRTFLMWLEMVVRRLSKLNKWRFWAGGSDGFLVFLKGRACPEDREVFIKILVRVEICGSFISNSWDGVWKRCSLRAHTSKK